MRADVLLVERGLAPTRTRAQALILAGAVFSEGDQRVDKPGLLLASDAALRVGQDPNPYVSRGGLKMAAALREFAIDVTGCVALDVGASTGGFTDCLLQHGAAKVFALDVGYGQLAWQLRQDPRVVVIERCNIRTADASHVPQCCDVIVFDVSFISLRLVLAPALRFAKAGAKLIALVKPQFEVGIDDIGKGGIVRDDAARHRVLADVRNIMEELGLEDIRTMDSPILGAKGNHEFLIAGAYNSR